MTKRGTYSTSHIYNRNILLCGDSHRIKSTCTRISTGTVIHTRTMDKNHIQNDIFSKNPTIFYTCQPPLAGCYCIRVVRLVVLACLALQPSCFLSLSPRLLQYLPIFSSCHILGCIVYSYPLNQYIYKYIPQSLVPGVYTS